MPSRAALIALVVAALCALLLVRGCKDGQPPAPASAPDASPDQAEAVQAKDEALALAQAEARARYEAAMRAAVSTLHRYLAQLPEDQAAADAFWSDGAPATGAVEADLRALPARPRQFRTRNGTPQVLEGEPVPTAVRIPVDLRLSPAEGPIRRYAGWYELRHSPADDAWRITGASVDVLPARQ